MYVPYAIHASDNLPSWTPHAHNNRYTHHVTYNTTHSRRWVGGWVGGVERWRGVLVVSCVWGVWGVDFELYLWMIGCVEHKFQVRSLAGAVLASNDNAGVLLVR